MDKYLQTLVEWTKKRYVLNTKSKNPFKDAHESFLELYELYDNNSYVKDKALQYYNDRELFNKKIAPDIKSFIKEVQTMFSSNSNTEKYKLVLKPMSSYPKLNLPNSSDFDLGVLVHNLDTVKLFYISKLLIANGYTLESVSSNKGSKSNAYRFSKMYKNIEVELKIRDYKLSAVIQKLHDKLNSISKVDSIFWTYNKYLLKFWSKKNKENVYEFFKTLIFHNYFYKIKGAFTLIPS
jgi:hypothetical protein